MMRHGMPSPSAPTLNQLLRYSLVSADSSLTKGTELAQEESLFWLFLGAFATLRHIDYLRHRLS
jgi:hypothetical protein